MLFLIYCSCAPHRLFVRGSFCGSKLSSKLRQFCSHSLICFYFRLYHSSQIRCVTDSLPWRGIHIPTDLFLVLTISLSINPTCLNEDFCPRHNCAKYYRQFIKKSTFRMLHFKNYIFFIITMENT